MAVRTHTLTATTGGNLFPKAYSDRIVIVPNGFGLHTGNENPVGSYTRWEYQVDNSAATSSECQPGLVLDQTAYIRAKIQNYGQFQAQVKCFTAAVLGTMFGRYESSGVGCGSVSTIATAVRRANVSPLNPDYNNNSPVYDMEDVRALAGLPSFLGDLEDIRIAYDMRLLGGGTQNKFLDMYLHDVSDEFRIPGGFPGPGYGTTDPFSSQPLSSAQQQLLNTVNGINYNLTKDWNINVWLGVPTPPNSVPVGQDSDNNWAGGTLIGRYNIGGIDHDFYYKLETAGANNFDYIGLVMVNPPDAGDIRVLDYMDFAKNTLPNIIATNSAAQALYGTAATRGKAPPRMPDNNHVLGGLHIGTEIFYTNTDGSEAVVEIPKLLFTVPSIGTFGWNKQGSTVTQNPTITRTVTVDEQIVITQTDVGNTSNFADAPTADINFVTVTGLGSTLRIRGNNLGSTVVGYIQEDGTTGEINVNIVEATTDDGGDTGSSGVTQGQSTNYTNTVPLFGELFIEWAEIHTSGNEIVQIVTESGSDKVRVAETSPRIKVEGFALGTSIIEYRTSANQTGTFTITTVADVDDPDTEDEVTPYIGTRWGNPGNTIKLNMNLMPRLSSGRTLVDEQGPGSALIAGDDLEITLPNNATGSGTVELDDE